MNVRRATHEDVPALRRLINAAYKPLGEMGLNFTGVTQDEETTRRRMQGSEVYIVEEASHMVGTVKVRARETDGVRYVEVAQLAVDPAC